MASQYTVAEVHGSKPKPDRGFGPMQEISLSLTNGDGEPQRVTWYTKATTQPPAPGSQLFGDVSEGQYGWQFKKAQNPMGGAPRPEDPARAARIKRMHSQDMAMRAIELVGWDRTLQPSQLRDAIKRWADWFDEDAEGS